MDSPLLSWYPLLLPTVGSFLVLFFLWRRESTRARLSLPPGPHAWPIVGKIFQLGKRPHESLHALSLQYGPLMTLHLGMKTIVLVSSPAMAKEVLKTHDNVFAGRMVIEAFKTLSHNKYSLVFGEYGPYWRHLRCIATVELFSTQKLDALQHLRRDQIFGMIRLIFEEKGNVVDIGKMMFCTTLNVLGNMFFSTSLFDPHNPSSSAGIKDTISDMMEVSGKFNLVDGFPFLRFLDPQGVSRDMTTHLKAMYDFCDMFIQRRLSAERDNSEKDFLDVLLDFRTEDFTVIGIRAFISELFVAGTESSTISIEWAMAELIRNPEKLKRLRQELDEVVGCNRKVEESDIDRLPYLHAAVKEILRLYPSGPLLVPNKAESSSEIGGFVIPKHSQVMVNAWAIGRDPSVWKNALEFMPERFLEVENSKIEYGGQNFELIPFGAGRRICLGLPLGSRMVHFTVASLLHSFEWILPDGIKCEDLDMRDDCVLSLKKAAKLNAIPKPLASAGTVGTIDTVAGSDTVVAANGAVDGIMGPFGGMNGIGDVSSFAVVLAVLVSSATSSSSLGILLLLDPNPLKWPPTTWWAWSSGLVDLTATREPAWVLVCGSRAVGGVRRTRVARAELRAQAQKLGGERKPGGDLPASVTGKPRQRQSGARRRQRGGSEHGVRSG
ncbi:cytochrome P450 76T24-like [Cryptomeria japonica]|uniref:cytochrome P450 76T24-like n=1 Tax=Cryptomeria japonica TaxID=3369 RepID=UPI0027DA4F8C|nr:cytochrome P450 76T24-like [Cryptomeria japonica]